MVIRGEHFMIYPGEIVLSAGWIDDAGDAELIQAVREIAEVARHPFLDATHCSGVADFDSVSEFFEALQQVEIHDATVIAKRDLVKARRSEFASNRSALKLALIERDTYVCAEPGCTATENLTIDHIVPLSRGGTDELENLQLLCPSHNSSKGDRVERPIDEVHRQQVEDMSKAVATARLVRSRFADSEASAQQRHQPDRQEVD